MSAQKPTSKRTGASRPKKTASQLLKTIAVPRIGADWPGEDGKFVAIVRGEKGQPDYRLIAPIHKSATFKGTWGQAERVKGADSEYDGLANTQAMAATGSEIAKRALATQIGKHKDFYIASPQELRLMRANTPELLPAGWTWTSRQSAATSYYAYAQYFAGGYQAGYHKVTEFWVRLVRRIPIQ